MADIVKQGYAKVKSKHLGKWNKRWLILRRASPGTGGSVRLEKYETEQAAGQLATSHCAVFDLGHAQSIERSPKPGIHIVLDDFTALEFATDSGAEADSWKRAIDQAMHGRSITSNGDMFEVYLMQSAKLPSSGECLLQVTADSVQLLDIDDPQRVQLSWPLGAIRRYTVERGMFSLEAGRKCTTGEGVFMFDTKEPDAIFEQVQRASQAMARHRSNDEDDE